MFNVVGGIGLGLIVEGIKGTIAGVNFEASSRKAGFGFQLGGNFMFLRRPHHSLGLGVMFSPAFFDGGSVYMIQGGLAYQYH